MTDKILDHILQNCIQEKYLDNTIVKISEFFKIPRNECSIILNDLINSKKCIRVDQKPYIFISTKYLKDIKNMNVIKDKYASLQDVFEENSSKKDFEKLVGYNQSLKDTVKQCKATISYPPNGLPMLLHGPTGTGKSYIARLTYEWAKNNNIINANGKFVIVNCSEYANNPELLTANLFGHVKGAFTGAEKDNDGLIALADNGVLFLDEVHELKAECQEKLFLFMDQGIYHRVGDNEKWYKSNVRLMFATTENPEQVLLKTLLRRIPMTITIPSLEQRGIQERIELLYYLFSNEQKRLNCNIKMSNKVYNALLTSKMSGNIGELKSVVQSCCINSLFDKEDGDLVIHLSSLPKKILNLVYENAKINQQSEEYIYIDVLQGFYASDKEVIHMNDEILKAYHNYKDKNMNIDEYMEVTKKVVQNYFDNLIFRKRETPQIEYYKRGVKYIFDLIESRYGLKLTNNEILSLAIYLDEINQDYNDMRCWTLKHEEECEDLNQLLSEEYFRATNLSLEICSYLKSYLEIDIHPIVITLFIFLLYNTKKDQRLAQKASVVLAHGFSTASSIATAANRFLGEYIFDAIDMPLHVDTNTMIEKLNLYLSRIGKIKELYLLVDMGSLEEIYKGLNVKNANIGIINNVSTLMALEIGNGIRRNIPMEELFETTIKQLDANLNYHIEKNKTKTPIILCSCASGIGTSRKLKQMIEESFPENVHIDVQTYNYNDLIRFEEHNELFEEYDVLCTIGTLDPNIKNIRFVGIEDLIINDSFELLNTYFNGYMSCEELNDFNKNILRNFSLSNIMNNLTILNPNKLLEQVSIAIDILQTSLHVRLTSRTCFGLYVHICCLIERLVISRGNEQYLDCLEFKKAHNDFIEYVKRSFKQVEEFYGVDIPVEEITYIYHYVENN